MPWKFVVLRDQEIIDGITQTIIETCKIYKGLIDYRYNGSILRRIIANIIIKSKPNDLHPVPFGAISLIADEKLGLFHNAPTVILIFADERGIGFPTLDCGIAGQNMVLAAHSMGLGTCWIGFPKVAFENTSIWRNRLGIDYPYKFVSSLAVGFPMGKPDGMVARPTHAVDWYEDGMKKTLY
jgi:nitroreductase